MPEPKSMINPTLNEIMDAHIDITGAVGVEVLTNPKGILHVNVNGICLLRVCQIKHFALNDRVIKDA